MLRYRIGLVALLLSMCISWSAAQEATPTFAGCGAGEYPTWTQEKNDCTLKQALTVETSYSYPEALNALPFAKAVVMEYITTSEMQFWGALTGGQFVQTNSAPWTLEITYETHEVLPDIMGIIFTHYEYTGGAHPNSWYITFTFDVANQKTLTLANILVDGDATLEDIAPTVQTTLTEQLGDLADAAWLEDGAGAEPENYAAWALTEDGLLFIFSPYQVAPYVAGVQQVLLPYSELTGILKPEYIPTEDGA